MGLDFATRMRHLRCVCEFAGKVQDYPTKPKREDWDAMGKEAQAEFPGGWQEYKEKRKAEIKTTLQCVKQKLEEARALLDAGEVLCTANDYNGVVSQVNAKLAEVDKE